MDAKEDPKAQKSPSTGSSMLYEKPQPRPPRSPAQSAKVRIQNRRRAYLDQHPAYFKSLEHELSDPILYDAMIRRFQSTEEREHEGRRKGYARVLEVDLLRGEAKLSQLAERTSSGSSGSAHQAPAADEEPSIIPKTNLESLEEDLGRPDTKDQGRERWEEFLRQRFIDGGDDDFDYGPVDEDDRYDVIERKDQEEAWFDDEEPGWTGEEGTNGAKRKDKLEGETGIQDF